MQYALIGFGNISPIHVRAITEVCKHEIVAICDTQLDALKDIGLPGVRLYQDYQVLLAKEKIDVAVILTPHYFHPEISAAALQAGCHVFCEKPVAVNKLHAAPIAEALEKTDRVFGVNFNKRFRPDVQAVKAVLNENRLGKLHLVNFVINKNLLRSSAYFRSGGGWRGTWSKEGGGIVIHQASHDIDRLVYLFGLPAEVMAQTGTSDLHHHIFVEDHADALLSYQNGMRLHFSTASHLHPGVDRLEIWGDRGYLKVENDVITTALLEDPLDIWNDRYQKDEQTENGRMIFGAPEPVYSEQKISPISFHAQHAAGHVNFVNAVAGKETVMTSFEQAMQSVELANAMVLASYHKTQIRLPLDAQAYDDFLQEMIKREQGA